MRIFANNLFNIEKFTIRAALPGITNDGIAELAKSLAKAQNLRSLKLALYEYKKQIN